jgi:hypothetical protein
VKTAGTLEAWFRKPEVAQHAVKSGPYFNILSSVEVIQAEVRPLYF